MSDPIQFRVVYYEGKKVVVGGGLRLDNPEECAKALNVMLESKLKLKAALEVAEALNRKYLKPLGTPSGEK
jgi:hypothetical protein